MRLLPNRVVQLVTCVTPDVWATQRSFWSTQVTQAMRSRTQPFEIEYVVPGLYLGD
jgi:hypothetical protein